MKGPAPKRIEIQMDELKAILERSTMEAEDRAKLEAALDTLGFLAQQIESKSTSIDRLRRILFGPKTETLGDVLPAQSTGKDARRRRSKEAGERPKPQGHGRNGAAAYTGATKIPVAHDQLKHGGGCPRCQKGKVYTQAEPKTLVRIVGVPPIQAKVYELERLRCNLCGDVFPATTPPGVGEEKYDASVAAMLALLKYGTGMPRYRLEGLQQSLGVPLPSTTQWDLVCERVPSLKPLLEEYIRQAAQAKVVYNDDTRGLILDWLGDKRPVPAEGDDERTGMFTTGIIAECEEGRISLFFTGTQHAGENLADVLMKRAAGSAPPIQMCDALNRNLPKPFKTILGNCLTHGRRNFVDVANRFPEACRHLFEELAVAYKVDEQARQEGLSPEERLSLHQRETAPRMTELQVWLVRQLEERIVEPNSGLGSAMQYMIKHWEKLTLFLRVPGAPIDNSLCERALKRVVMHRKNALFYKTKAGADVGDLFMSLVHTAELAQANVFDYLLQLMRHPGEVTAQPHRWMPWNYLSAIPAAVAKVTD